MRVQVDLLPGKEVSVVDVLGGVEGLEDGGSQEVVDVNDFVVVLR